MNMGNCNIVAVIRSETSALAGKLAVVDGGIELSYGALLAAVDRVTAGLKSVGVKPLERVAFLCEDSADYIIASLAILSAGAVVVTVSTSLMGNEPKSG